MLPLLFRQDKELGSEVEGELDVAFLVYCESIWLHALQMLTDQVVVHGELQVTKPTTTILLKNLMQHIFNSVYF